VLWIRDVAQRLAEKREARRDDDHGQQGSHQGQAEIAA
jgi:hypothetical protein